MKYCLGQCLILFIHAVLWPRECMLSALHAAYYSIPQLFFDRRALYFQFLHPRLVVNFLFILQRSPAFQWIWLKFLGRGVLPLLLPSSCRAISEARWKKYSQSAHVAGILAFLASFSILFPGWRCMTCVCCRTQSGGWVFLELLCFSRVVKASLIL